MSDLIKLDIAEGTAKLTLSNGKVNAFSHDMINQFQAALDEVESAKVPVVITGQPGMFSGGFDLKVMQSGPANAIALVTEGSKLTRRLLAFPTPVISACTGHAVAKGAFILLCSDYRLGAEGAFKIGLNEVAIGITMHYAGIAMAKHGLTDSYVNRSLYLAEMFDPKGAVKAGFLDELLPADTVIDSAMIRADACTGLNMKAYVGTKLKAREALLSQMDHAIEVDAKGTL